MTDGAPIKLLLTCNVFTSRDTYVFVSFGCLKYTTRTTILKQSSLFLQFFFHIFTQYLRVMTHFINALYEFSVRHLTVTFLRSRLFVGRFKIMSNTKTCQVYLYIISYYKIETRQHFGDNFMSVFLYIKHVKHKYKNKNKHFFLLFFLLSFQKSLQ